MATTVQYHTNVPRGDDPTVPGWAWVNMSDGWAFTRSYAVRDMLNVISTPQIIHDTTHGSNNVVTYIWLPYASDPNKGTVILFNDDRNLDLFIEFCKKYNLAGVFFWTQDGDSNGYYTNYINKGLNSK